MSSSVRSFFLRGSMKTTGALAASTGLLSQVSSPGVLSDRSCEIPVQWWRQARASGIPLYLYCREQRSKIPSHATCTFDGLVGEGNVAFNNHSITGPSFAQWSSVRLAVLESWLQIRLKDTLNFFLSSKGIYFLPSRKCAFASCYKSQFSSGLQVNSYKNSMRKLPKTI